MVKAKFNTQKIIEVEKKWKQRWKNALKQWKT